MLKDQRYDIRKIWHSVYALSLKGRRHSSIYFILIIISYQQQAQQISSPGGFLEVGNSHLPPPVIYPSKGASGKKGKKFADLVPDYLSSSEVLQKADRLNC